jgi:hypothetical protein
MNEPHLKNMPERLFMHGDKDGAEAKALEINEAGGFAWVEAEYGSDMGHDNVFWGYRVMFISPERVERRMVRVKLEDQEREAGVGS